ncbi:hypothetical protein AK812_SmicGene18646 [Symbiodinium microadriaticum]|uniref:Uncharacterized protein n=1 Tax=Symbiodinium microadriaticum TaxID=2951 RepID=A0A1Q9DUK5_SYMMI|nr:hypothetical protein AK812_SmicGene18646 [Symbiodinium microadriaticum]
MTGVPLDALLEWSALMLDGVDAARTQGVWEWSPKSAQDPAEWLEYRHRNLQWRTGLASGAHGEVSDLVSDEVSAPPVDFFSPVPDLQTWEGDFKSGAAYHLPQTPRLVADVALKIWMLSPEMESDLKVGTYAACPLTVLLSSASVERSWAKIVGHSADGVAIKGPDEVPSNLFLGRRRCFDLRSILTFAPAGIGWAMADACEVGTCYAQHTQTGGRPTLQILSTGIEDAQNDPSSVMAVARMDPATYGVLSQDNACYTEYIVCILACLSCICMAYCMTPDESRPNAERLFEWRLHHESLQITLKRHSPLPEDETQEQLAGVLFAMCKAHVYVEMCFKSGAGEPMRLHVQMTQVSFSSIIAATTAYLFICGVQNEVGDRGFNPAPFSKNICNAASLVVTYGFTVLVAREKDFSVLKAFLLVAIVMEVINYCYTRRVVKQPKEEIPVAEYSNLYLTGGHVFRPFASALGIVFPFGGPTAPMGRRGFALPSVYFTKWVAIQNSRLWGLYICVYVILVALVAASIALFQVYFVPVEPHLRLQLWNDVTGLTGAHPGREDFDFV